MFTRLGLVLKGKCGGQIKASQPKTVVNHHVLVGGTRSSPSDTDFVVEINSLEAADGTISKGEVVCHYHLELASVGSVSYELLTASTESPG